MHSRFPWLLLLALGALLVAPLALADDGLAPEDRAPVTAKNIVGDWETGDHDKKEVYLLKADGSFRVEIDDEEGAGFMDGTWSFQNNVLSMTGTGEDEDLRFRVKRIAKDLLDLHLIHEKETGVRRWRLKDPNRPADPPLAGIWTAETTDVPWVLILKESGAFESRAGKTLTGRWKQSPTSLHLLHHGKTGTTFETDTIIDMNIRWLGKDSLELTGTLPGAEPERLRRGEAPAHMPTPTPLVGVWVASDGTTSIQLTIQANGSFEQILESGAGRSVTRGAWGIRGTNFVVTPEGEKEDLLIPFQLIDNNQLVLQAAGEQTVLVRKDGGTIADPPQDPPGGGGIYGTWLMRGESIEMRIEIRRDGTYSEVTTTNGETEKNTGRFEVQGNVLIAHVDGGETVKLNWRLVDANTLEILDDAGKGARLKRQP